MTKRRRSRKRKSRGQSQAYQDWVEEEELPKKPEPGTVVVDEETLRAVQNKVDVEEFKEHGYRCDRCGFLSKKRGLSGIQALRAHTRVHVRDRRASFLPIKIHGSVLLIAVAIAVLWLFVDPPPLPGAVTLPDMSNWHAQAVAVGVPAILLSYTFILTARFGMSGRRGLVRPMEVGVLAGDVLVLAAALAWPVLVEHGLDWRWLLPSTAPPLLSGALFSPSKNGVLLSVKRREFVPGGYRKVLRARTDEGDDQFMEFRSDLVRRIRDGRIVLSNVSRAEKKLFAKLGLSNVHPDDRAVQRRLQAEARRNGVRRPVRGSRGGVKAARSTRSAPRAPVRRTRRSVLNKGTIGDDASTK